MDGTEKRHKSCSLVVVRDTVGLIGLVHDEGGALQGTGADHTGEALGMVGFASGPQHAVSDGLPTGVALLQSFLADQSEQVVREVSPKAHPAPPQPKAPTQTYSIAALTIGGPLHAIELLSLQLLLTLVASEAGDVEQLSQGTDGRL